ncbi:MAG: Clp1/GlmU family protein [Candidatus Bathyarchaeota archaeon]|nr:Clp1/GlmU family protein [Candidatus Bathyarchaeota archaeon]
MKRTIEKGHTLLVDGPACVNLLAGKVEVFGAPLKTGVKIVIRESKRVAFEAKQKAHFDLMLGEKASVEEFKGSTIPASWEKACNTTLAFEEKPVIVVVMGEVDSGKTSFCTYLANKALRKERRVAIIDADLGQSDIGPPSTIGFSRLTLPTLDPFLLNAENAYFIGTTTPNGALNKVIDKLAKMKDEGLKKAVDFLVINTDGWVVGEEAVQYKLRLAKRIAPSVVVGIQQQNELTPILSALKGIKVISIESPPAIKKRDREKRKSLRELSYKKYLKGAKVQSFPLSWVKVEGIPFGTGVTPSERRLEKIRSKLEVNLLYCEETLNLTVVVLEKNQWIDEEQIPNLEEELGKKVKLIQEGDEQGLLVGLHDEEEKFLGIGILNKIDYGRHVIQVCTPVTANISSIHVGQVKLDKQGKEIGISPVFRDYYTSV